jgi:hypothetical protein
MIDGTNDRAARMLGLDGLCRTVKFNATGRSADLQSRRAGDWPVVPDAVEVFEPWFSVGFMRPPLPSVNGASPGGSRSLPAPLHYVKDAGQATSQAKRRARPASLVDCEPNGSPPPIMLLGGMRAFARIGASTH